MEIKLTDYLTKVYQEEIEKVFQKELEDPDYLNQSEFATCLDRAKAGNEIAMVRPNKILGLATASHRQIDEKHKEDRSAEIEELAKDLSPEDVAVAVRGWWGG